MTIEIKAPAFPESVADGEVAAWHKKEGDAVARDELIVEIETDKVVMEVVAPEDGVITKIHVQEGDTIEIDIPNRVIRVALSEAVLQQRRAAMDAKGAGAWRPVQRERYVSQALQAYAALTTSAAKGAVRDLTQLNK